MDISGNFRISMTNAINSFRSKFYKSIDPETESIRFTRELPNLQSYFEILSNGIEVHVQLKVPGHTLREFTINMIRFQFLNSYIKVLTSIETIPELDIDLSVATTTIDFYGLDFIGFIKYYGDQIIQYVSNTDG